MRIKLILIFGCVVILTAGGVLFFLDRKEEVKHDNVSEYLTDQFRYSITESQDSKIEMPTKAAHEERVNAYVEMGKENPDFIGWVRIDKTRIDTPVMYTPDREDYYLTRSFNKGSSPYGTPYVLDFCKVGQNKSAAIVGHSADNGAVFTDLLKYNDQTYCENHNIIKYDTVYDAGEYEVQCVIQITGNDGELIRSLVNPVNSSDFRSAVNQLSTLSYYTMDTVLNEYDTLLVLITCIPDVEDSRIAVIAKRLVEG